ncbi:MAG: hypothetical protein LAT67_01185 [Balneolales bacterium]|nr:hypothetical protein [Balneolales bacterium]
MSASAYFRISFLLLGVFFITNSALAKEDVNLPDVQYLYDEDSVIENGILTMNDDIQWRLMNNRDMEFKGSAVVILHQNGDLPSTGNTADGAAGRANRTTMAGMLYANGEQVPVTLIRGESRRARQQGFRVALVYADPENRTLSLTDGTTRRVIDRSISFDFQSSGLIEMIISRDRRFILDLSRGLRIAVAPSSSR